MLQEQDRLQREASTLADRLEAVLQEKRQRRLSFDAETPMDKTLNYLQSAIIVSGCCFLCSTAPAHPKTRYITGLGAPTVFRMLVIVILQCSN